MWKTETKYYDIFKIIKLHHIYDLSLTIKNDLWSASND